MMEKLTNLADYFRKIPAAFLVAIVTVLGLMLFLPEEYAQIVAVDGFRNEYRVYLGPAFLLTLSFCAARVFIFIMQGQAQRKALKRKQKDLQKLYVGMEDGVMSGLRAKGITYLAANTGDVLNGFAFNLQPWAREYLESNSHLLDGYVGQPMTPQQKLHLRW